MKILITGTNSFLAKSLANALLAKSYNIFALSRMVSAHKIPPHLKKNLDILIYTSTDEIRNFIKKTSPDIVIHTANLYGRNLRSLSDVEEVNVIFGAKILDCLNELDKKILFINAGTALPKNLSLYSLSKFHFLELGKFISKQEKSKIHFINLKLQHFFGAGDDPTKFTSHVINSCLRNVKHIDLTCGEQLRDFIYIDDVIDAYIRIIEGKDSLARYEEFEIGSGKEIKIEEFVRLVHKITHSKTQLNFGALPLRKNEPRTCVADISKMRSKFQWAPIFTIESGIHKTISMAHEEVA
jgi:CDP-paratose synthetase